MLLSVTYIFFMVLIVHVESDYLRGVFGQVQLLISVLLVLIGYRRAFILSLSLITVSLILALGHTVQTGTTEALPGIISYTAALVIISVLYFFRQQHLKQLITLNKQRKRLKILAEIDGLTLTYNRRTFILRLQEKIANQHKLAVAFVDLDNFKWINDRYNHHVGDRILEVMAERIYHVLGQAATVGRLGGDEFGILLTDFDPNEQVALFRRLQEVMSNPIVVEDLSLVVTTSMGVSYYPTDGERAEDLIRKADVAMYHVKNNEKNHYCFYRSTLDQEIQ